MKFGLLVLNMNDNFIPNFVCQPIKIYLTVERFLILLKTDKYYRQMS